MSKQELFEIHKVEAYRTLLLMEPQDERKKKKGIETGAVHYTYKTISQL